MNIKLTLFTDPAILAHVQRNILSRFLEDYQQYLPSDAATLLQTSLNSLTFEEYCAAWASQFALANQFGATLLEALHAIEFLALPENASILDETLSHLPPGYGIDRGLSSLHQALHLWLLAHSPAGVSWPNGVAEPPPETALVQPGRAERPCEALPPNHGPDASDASSAHSTDGVSAGSDEISNPPSVIPKPQVPDALSTLNSQLPTSNAASISNLPSPISEPASSELPSPISSSSAPAEDDPAESEAQADAVPLRRLKPWPDPISDAPALFDQVHDRALHYLFLPPGAAVVFTLWPGHAHAVKAFTHSPRLYVTSAESGCGKTTALDFIACLCPDVLRTDNLKPSVLYRVTHKHEPTMVLDEFDSYAQQYPDLRGLINAGHNLHGCATRCEGPNVRFFKAYAATAIAGIGDLAPTLAHRSIIIRLTRAPAGALQARFDRRHTKFETTLGRKIARWVQDNYAAIAACDPVLPPEVINRLADNWRPLFAVAQIIGGHWPQRVIEAFNALQTLNAQQSAAPSAAQPPDTATLLLGDVRQVFADTGADRLFASYIVRALHAMPNSPWAGTHNGAKPITVTSLGRHLSSLGIHSRPIRIGADLARGYLLSAIAPPSPNGPTALDFQI